MELKRLAAGFILVLGTMIHPHAEGEIDTAGIEFDFDRDGITDRKDWDELADMIWKSFERDIEDDRFERTNCYWFNYVFVNKNHQMFSCVESDFFDIKEEGRLADFNNYTEEQLNEGPDKQTLSYIKEHVEVIKSRLKELKSDKFKKEAADMIRGLLSEKEA